MSKHSAERFLQEATPQPGDPTFSIIRTHLLIEDLLRTFLEKVAANPAAVAKAQLSFAQAVQVARAFCTSVPHDDWMWKAMTDLNKLRNLLAHNLNPGELEAKVDAYMSLVINSSDVPLPEPTEWVTPEHTEPSDRATVSHIYSEMDMVNIGLYASVLGALGLYQDN